MNYRLQPSTPPDATRQRGRGMAQPKVTLLHRKYVWSVCEACQIV